MFMPPVFPAHWHVSQPVLIADTFSSLVWKVSLPDGTPAIVKGLKPIEDIADELRGADYLVWRNGRGAVRLLGRENNLMLLEYAGERMLSHIVAEHGDYQATEIAAELMAKLYAASEEPLPSALLPSRDRFAALFQRARDDQNAGCQTDYVHAAIIADQMMSNASELRGLHGDLHHENIMFSSRGWLVIDPVGLVGEVGFGAANMFYDPADRDDLCLDPRRIAQMADAFSRALDVDPRRLLDQAYAYGCLSAAWNADGEEEQRDLAIAAVFFFKQKTAYEIKRHVPSGCSAGYFPFTCPPWLPDINCCGFRSPSCFSIWSVLKPFIWLSTDGGIGTGLSAFSSSFR